MAKNVISTDNGDTDSKCTMYYQTTTTEVKIHKQLHLKSSGSKVSYELISRLPLCLFPFLILQQSPSSLKSIGLN